MKKLWYKLLIDTLEIGDIDNIGLWICSINVVGLHEISGLVPVVGLCFFLWDRTPAGCGYVSGGGAWWVTDWRPGCCTSWWLWRTMWHWPAWRGLTCPGMASDCDALADVGCWSHHDYEPEHWGVVSHPGSDLWLLCLSTWLWNYIMIDLLNVLESYWIVVVIVLYCYEILKILIYIFDCLLGGYFVKLGLCLSWHSLAQASTCCI